MKRKYVLTGDLICCAQVGIGYQVSRVIEDSQIGANKCLYGGTAGLIGTNMENKIMLHCVAKLFDCFLGFGSFAPMAIS